MIALSLTKFYRDALNTEVLNNYFLDASHFTHLSIGHMNENQF